MVRKVNHKPEVPIFLICFSPTLQLPQVSSVSVSQNTPATPLENHKECLATVEALERENGALMRDKDTLSERIRELEGENQKLLNHQHQLSHLLSRTNDIQRFVGELRDTVASWQQRLQDPVHPPNHSNPVAMSTALPAATSLQDMWDAQEEGAGVFNGSDVLPGSDNFTQLFEI
jgi:FtsZ-binding cell division protein ZapB